MSEPVVIITPNSGEHNRSAKATAERLRTGKQYTDLSTVCIIPTRGVIPAAVVESWLGLMTPMNNRFARMFVSGMEVGDAYNIAVSHVLADPGLSKFRFILTLEEDNMPPADGLLKLYENICMCPKLCKDHYASVAGLYFTKYEGGQPMVYGNPKGLLTFEPQMPKTNAVQECNGTGMGLTLFRTDLFRDKQLDKDNWFRTVQSVEEGAGTQDLYFYGNVRKLGYRVASDNRVRVGHWDQENMHAW